MPTSTPKSIYDYYTYSVGILGGRGSGKRLYRTKEELIDGIQSFFHSIVNPDGTYNRPPTMGGLGLHLGFASKMWPDKYVNNEEFADVIEHARQSIDVWRHEQTVVPTKGVYPAGLMFLIARNEEHALHYENMKDITPDTEVDRPKEAELLIDEVWSKKDG